MRQFQVPQFIEVEDKIFGPLTLKQFLYVLGGGSIAFLLWTFLPRLLAVLLIIPIGAFFAALAFYKVNERPFIKMIENALAHYSQARLYVWKRTERKTQKGKLGLAAEAPAKAGLSLPKLTESKLRELSWSLDIQERLAEGHESRSLNRNRDAA